MVAQDVLEGSPEGNPEHILEVAPDFEVSEVDPGVEYVCAEVFGQEPGFLVPLVVEPDFEVLVPLVVEPGFEVLVLLEVKPDFLVHPVEVFARDIPAEMVLDRHLV